MKPTIEELREYFELTKEIGEYISRQCGGKGKMVDDPNPFYSQINNLGMGLDEYYGMPHGLMTPLGEWRINTSCVVMDEWWLSCPDLVVKEIRAITQDNMGQYGPVYEIISFRGKKLPELDVTITGYWLSPTTVMNYTYEEATELLKELGLYQSLA